MRAAGSSGILPDDSMIEVAIEALTMVIPTQEGADRW